MNFNKYLSLVKRQWKYFLIGLLVIGGATFWLFRGQDQTTEILTVGLSTFEQTVQVSGESKAGSFVDLAFEQTGKVARVGARVGDRVGAGDLLIALDSAKARADLLSAEASLEYEQAKLADSQVSLNDAEAALRDVLVDSYTKADDVVSNYANRFFIGPDSPSPIFSISFNDNGQTVSFDISDAEKKVALAKKKVVVNKIMTDWRNDKNVDELSESNIMKIEGRLAEIRSLLDLLSSAVNSISTSDYQYQSTIDGYRKDISTARSSVETVISKISSAKKDWNTSRLSAGQFSINQPSTQSAQIKQAEAVVAEKRAILANFSLVSPISGVVTKQEGRVGEAVTAGEVVVSVINPDSFEVEANIPEINIGKIKLGQEALVTFDAFPDEKFTGKVFYIDPAATIVDGVVNYKIKVAFGQSNSQIKNGLTTNLSITTLKKDKVITIPVYALTTKGGVTTVDKEVAGEIVKTKVEVGAYGDGGTVEIINGLKVGDKIVAVKK